MRGGRLREVVAMRELTVYQTIERVFHPIFPHTSKLVKLGWAHCLATFKRFLGVWKSGKLKHFSKCLIFQFSLL